MIPFVTIELDRPRRLRFGMGAIIEYERLTGKKIQDCDDELTVEEISKLLWVMLHQDEPELTQEQTIKLVDEHAKSVKDVENKVVEAIVAAFDTGKKAKNV